MEKDLRKKASIIIDMRFLQENTIDTWGRDLANSVKAFYNNLRIGDNRGDYEFAGLVFILPDGGDSVVNLKDLKLKGRRDRQTLFNRIVEKVVEQHNLSFPKPLDFYDDTRNKRHAERTQDVAFGSEETKIGLRSLVVGSDSEIGQQEITQEYRGRRLCPDD